MPTEKTRTTHVWRAKNRDDDEIWLDLERVDKFVSTEGQGPGYKKTTRNMFWGDEANEDAHPTRTQVELDVENPEDEETFVPVNVIERMVTRRGQGPGYLKSTKKYINDREQNQTREVSIRRVYHWDTETDPSEDGGHNYVRIEGTEDRSQYKDVAVIESITTKSGQGPGYKKRTFRFNTGPIKEFSEPSPSDVDMSKVVHLDPWQNIVNVQWADGPNAAVVAMTVDTGGGEGSDACVLVSRDGLTWKRVTLMGGGSGFAQCVAYNSWHKNFVVGGFEVTGDGSPMTGLRALLHRSDTDILNNWTDISPGGFAWITTLHSDPFRELVHGGTSRSTASTGFASRGALFASREGDVSDLHDEIDHSTVEGVQQYFNTGYDYLVGAKLSSIGKVFGSTPTAPKRPIAIRLNPSNDLNDGLTLGGAYVDRGHRSKVLVSFDTETGGGERPVTIVPSGGSSSSPGVIKAVAGDGYCIAVAASLTTGPMQSVVKMSRDGLNWTTVRDKTITDEAVVGCGYLKGRAVPGQPAPKGVYYTVWTGYNDGLSNSGCYIEVTSDGGKTWTEAFRAGPGTYLFRTASGHVPYSES